MVTKPCEAQLERARRTKNHISKILNDYSKGKVSVAPFRLFDMMHTFFCDSHHIKDYIIRDKSLTITSKTIDIFIGSNDCLKISADICNGRKHFQLRNGGWTGDKPRFHMNLQVKEDRNEIYVDFRSKIGDYEFFKLADDCIQTWEEFIRNNVK